MEDIRQGVCPKCGHNEIIEGSPRYSIKTGGTAPLAVAFEHDVGSSSGEGLHTMGTLSVFVCRACGKAEWFVAHPELVKIGDEYRTRLIQGPAKPDAPYR